MMMKKISIGNDRNQEILRRDEVIPGEVRQFIGIRLEKEMYGIPIERGRSCDTTSILYVYPWYGASIMGLMKSAR